MVFADPLPVHRMSPKPALGRSPTTSRRRSRYDDATGRSVKCVSHAIRPIQKALGNTKWKEYNSGGRKYWYHVRVYRFQ